MLVGVGRLCSKCQGERRQRLRKLVHPMHNQSLLSRPLCRLGGRGSGSLHLRLIKSSQATICEEWAHVGSKGIGQQLPAG